jgi:hypothetical protein
LSDDEVFILIVSGVIGVVGAFSTRVSCLPGMFTRSNPSIGLMRLAVVASVVWTAFVIQFYGDPSIKGIYVAFYLIMAYAATKLFGQLGAGLYGFRLRSDAYERKNLAVSVFIAGFTLATGIVFGGSLWGEADPLSGSEGGWWIPVGFFLMGWVTLGVSTGIYLWREPGRLRTQLCQDRDTAMAWSAAVYAISTSTLILRAVAGDFWGWRHGILGMGVIGLMLIGHEVVMFIGGKMPQAPLLRVFERCLYIGLAAAVFLLNQLIDRLYVGA